jgi:hypothetical protein
MVSRSSPRCAFWFCLAVIPLLAALEFDTSHAERELPTMLNLTGLFGLQGFLAELFGVRAGADEVSFPRRMLNPLGFPVFWRRRLPVSRISRVDPWGDCTTRLFLTSGEFFDLVLADEHAKERFLKNVVRSASKALR